MGNPSSKIGQEIQVEETAAGSLPSTPILTPKTRIIGLDPRSPSNNVVRTPIQVLLTSNRKQLSKATNHLVSETVGDPRSPSYDFTRTPIVVFENAKLLPPNIHNKNLDNVRKTLTSYTPTKVNEDHIVPNKIIAPILLESSPITSKVMETKRKSFVGLLETNLDFIETNLDTVPIQQNMQDENTQNVSIQPISPITDLMEKSLAEVESVPLDRSIERDVLLEHENNLENKVQHTTEDYIGTVSDCSKVETSDLHNTIGNVKDFDKKLTNLIYEDQDASSSIVKSVTLIEGKRTPLRVRNENSHSNPKKHQLKLKVNDKPRKLEKETSKIPVFKDKQIKGKFNQCENTPPRNIDELRNRKTNNHWDPNNTLII